MRSIITSLLLLLVGSLIAMGQAGPQINPANQVQWPTGSAGCVYAPGTNTCVPNSGGSGGYTNVTGSASQTTVAAINSACGTGTFYATTPLSIATGGTVTCPVQFARAGAWTIASGQNVAFSKGVTQTDTPSQIFAGAGTVSFSTTLQPVVQCAWFGDVPDYTGGLGGTDDTAAIQACVNAQTNGKALLQPGGHKISSAIVMNIKPNVTLEGPDIGSTALSFTTVSPRAFLIQITAGADGVDITNTGAGYVQGTGIRNVDVFSYNQASGTSNGVKVDKISNVILQNITAADFINDFNYGNLEGSDIDRIDHLVGVYGYNQTGGSYGAITLCAHNFSSSGGYISSYFNHLLGAFNTGVQGTSTSAGYCITGTDISDLTVSNYESSGTNYGVWVTTAATGFNAYDIKFVTGVLDSPFTSCVLESSYSGQQLNFNDLTCNGIPATGKGIDIESSANTTFTAVRTQNGGTQNSNLFYINGSNRITVNGMVSTWGQQLPVAVLNSSANVTITGCNINAAPPSAGTYAIIQYLGSSHNTLSGCTLNGALGSARAAISYDATSTDNTAIDNSYGTVLSSPPVADSGTNNRWCYSGGCTNLSTGFPITLGSTSIAAGSTTTAVGGLTLNSPTLVTPALGTPASGVLTNATGLPAASVVAGALANGMTATTQTVGDNTTKIATDAFVLANATSAGVSSITPGTNVTCTPNVSGTCSGAVTVNASGGGGSGAWTNITGSVTSSGCTVTSGVCTVGVGGSATVSFSSIPGTYNEIVIVLSGQNDDTTAEWDAVWLEFNSDTGGNYGYSYWSTVGSSSSDGITPGAQVSAAILTKGVNASISSSAHVHIPNYANTSFWHNYSTDIEGGVGSGQLRTQASSGIWHSTAAITSVLVGNAGANKFSQNTTFIVYGIQ